MERPPPVPFTPELPNLAGFDVIHSLRISDLVRLVVRRIKTSINTKQELGSNPTNGVFFSHSNASSTDVKVVPIELTCRTVSEVIQSGSTAESLLPHFARSVVVNRLAQFLSLFLSQRDESPTSSWSVFGHKRTATVLALLAGGSEFFASKTQNFVPALFLGVLGYRTN